MQHKIILTLCLLLATTAWAEETARTWKSVSGKVLLENASWDGQNNSDPNMVFLRKDGKQYKIAFEKLSKEDQMYVTSSKSHTTDTAQAPRLTPVIQSGHRSHVDSIVFTPDKQHFIASGMEFILWDVETGQQVRSYEEYFNVFGLTRDGLEVFGWYHGEFCKFNLKTGEIQENKLVDFDNYECSKEDVSFDQYGTKILLPERNKDGALPKASLFDTTTKRHIVTLHSKGGVEKGRLSSDGRIAVIYSVVKVVRKIPPTYVTLPKGQRIRLPGLDTETIETHYLQAFDCQSGRNLWTQEIDMSYFHDMEIMPDGKNFVFFYRKYSDEHSKMNIYNLLNGSIQTHFPIKREDNFSNGICISPNGDQIAISDDADLRVVSAVNGREIAYFKGGVNEIDNLVFSPDGTKVVTSSHKNIHIFDLVSLTSKLLGEDHIRDYSLECWSASNDGKTVVTFPGRHVLVYDGRTGFVEKLLKHPNPDHMDKCELSISDNGKFVALSSTHLGDAEIVVWDRETGDVIETFSFKLDYSTTHPAIDFSRDSQKFACFSFIKKDGKDYERLFIYDLTKQQMLRDFQKEKSSYDSDCGYLRFDTSGQKLFGNSGKDFCCWDVETGNKRVLFHIENLHTPEASISPSGKYIASWQYKEVQKEKYSSYERSGKILIYDAQTMRIVKTLWIDYPSDVSINDYEYLEFSHDDNYLWIREPVRDGNSTKFKSLLCLDIKTGKITRRIPLIDGFELDYFCVTSDNGVLAYYSTSSGDLGGTLMKFDTISGCPIANYESGKTFCLYDCEYEESTERIIASGAEVSFIDSKSGTFLGSIPAIDNGYCDITISENRQYALIYSYIDECFFSFWNIQKMRPINSFYKTREGHLSKMSLRDDGIAVAFFWQSRDEKTVRPGEESNTYTLLFMDANTGKFLRQISLPIRKKRDGSTADTFTWTDNNHFIYSRSYWKEEDKDEATTLNYQVNLSNFQLSYDEKVEQKKYPYAKADEKKIEIVFQDKAKTITYDNSDYLKDNIAESSNFFIDPKSNRVLMRYYAFNAGRDWLAITPEGLFDGTPEARRLVTYRMGDTLNVQPVEAFFQDFYYPGLFGAIWKGERPMPNVKVKEQIPPEIVIVSPKSSESSEGKVRFEVVVKNMGGGIQKPSITINEIGVGVKEKPIVTEKEVRWSFDLPLTNGDNNVVIRSATADGQIACQSQPVTIHYLPKLENPPRLFVLTVGVSDYTAGAKNDLQCAAADAVALAKAFESNGKRFYGEDGVFIKTLTEKDVTKEKIQQAIQEIARNANPEDIFIFSLAGHGSTVGQLYYYYPVNFPFEDDYQPVDSVIRENGIGGDILNDWINSVPAMKRIVIYDTCQSEAALKRNAMEERKAMEMLSKMTGCYTIAAAAGKEAALELPDVGHGVLTYALLGGLGVAEKGLLKDRSAASEDGLIRVRDWLGFAQDNVGKLSELSFGTEQRAIFQSGANNFPLLKK